MVQHSRGGHPGYKGTCEYTYAQEEDLTSMRQISCFKTSLGEAKLVLIMELTGFPRMEFHVSLLGTHAILSSLYRVFLVLSGIAEAKCFSVFSVWSLNRMPSHGIYYSR